MILYVPFADGKICKISLRYSFAIYLDITNPETPPRESVKPYSYCIFSCTLVDSITPFCAIYRFLSKSRVTEKQL